MNIELTIGWKTGGPNGRDIDTRLLMLLRGIREQGSLRAAADYTGVSYRFAWGLIREWGEYLGKPLVELTRGRGAGLTIVGEKLLWAEQLFHTRLEPELTSLKDELNSEMAKVLSPAEKNKVLTVNASHGLAIAYLESLCQKSRNIELNFQFRGSLESLRLLAGSHCDVAGFHFPSGELSHTLAPLYRQWLDEEKHTLLQVATRQQGLIFQHANPHRIKAIGDLTRRSLRFVNRQKESGTRTIFDELLKREGIDRKEIKGYYDEEFTHIAVAAVIASGAADVGFGIKAVASKFRLGFIPLIDETYVLAISKSVPAETLLELKQLLISRKFRAKIGTLPGNNTGNSGKVIEFADLW